MINNNNQYVITYHAKQRIKERGINMNQFLKKDLLYSNIRNMITTKEGYQIRYTKNNLKIVMKGNKVITLYKVRASSIKRDMMQYNF